MFTSDEILTLTHGKRLQGKPLREKPARFTSVSTDTRKLQKGGLFIALKGPHFNGHDFLLEAFEKGAKGALTEEKKIPPNLPNSFSLIYVPSTLRALHQLAKAHRERFTLPIIGITGSTGKTTTKDFIASVLSQKGKTLKNFENFNNEIGVPLTLFQLTKQHRYAVVEMGTQKPGDMKQLTEMVRPTHIVITNIGMSHMAFFESKEEIAREKSQILTSQAPHDLALLNGDDPLFPFLSDLARRKKWTVLSFGMKREASVRVSHIWHQGLRTFFSAGKETYGLPIPGTHNAYNALPAIALGEHFHLSPQKIQKGFKTFHPSKNRMKILRSPRGFRILNDTYNANPDSMKAALLTLHHISNGAGRKIALLGDMLELGKMEEEGHTAIGSFLSEYPIDILITTGKRAKKIGLLLKKNKTATKIYHPSRESLPVFLKTILLPHDTLLLKASRALHLEKIIDDLLTCH